MHRWNKSTSSSQHEDSSGACSNSHLGECSAGEVGRSPTRTKVDRPCQQSGELAMERADGGRERQALIRQPLMDHALALDSTPQRSRLHGSGGSSAASVGGTGAPPTHLSQEMHTRLTSQLSWRHCAGSSFVCHIRATRSCGLQRHSFQSNPERAHVVRSAKLIGRNNLAQGKANKNVPSRHSDWM